ncbi:TIGR03808 family TAT-translocated repetitive protein [Mesorhizobium sp. CAU 1741]|uniref:TIGR03808 family TAT-translocated repetitive protein n=1 Tax=Mesorhizobium sp. CAU 1741 TaxID=3140366 RepID=UPI00325C0240
MNRRQWMSGIAALGSGLTALAPAAFAQTRSPVVSALRGSLDATDFGIQPDLGTDQSAAFERMLSEASGDSVFLPAGRYVVAGIRLPAETRLTGVPGATRLICGGGSLIVADDAAIVHFEGLVFDGAREALVDQTRALVEIRRAADVVIDRCEVLGSSKSAIVLERCSGRVERTSIRDAADYAIYSVEAERMRIASNTVRDCAEGGILVHRWERGSDGTVVTDNRIESIGARSGGTGQYGNGINVYRADNVIISGNHVADCAFSAIRANSASNIQITGNQCLRSGETAIYAEFAFEGALISGNIVDTAAIGISIANLNDGGRLAVCSGNVVRNLVDAGPYEPFEAMGFGVGISAEADTAITGNVIEGAPRCAVLLGWGPYLRNVVATGNMIRDAREGFAISVVEGVGPVLVADNVISEVEHAVIGYRWRDTATGELADDDGETFPGLSIERNLVS